MKNVLLALVLLTAGSLGVAVYAQQATNDLVSPTGAEVINTYANTLLSQVYSTQLRDARGYQKVTGSPTSVTFAYGQSMMQIPNNTTTTINLAATPVDGQENCFYTKAAISSLTLQATQTIAPGEAITAAAATTRYCYLYSLANTTWTRTQ